MPVRNPISLRMRWQFAASALQGTQPVLSAKIARVPSSPVEIGSGERPEHPYLPSPARNKVAGLKLSPWPAIVVCGASTRSPQTQIDDDLGFGGTTSHAQCDDASRDARLGRAIKSCRWAVFCGPKQTWVSALQMS